MLIGLNGVSRSGKDSVAQILVEKYNFEQRALATAIRQILLDLNPWLRDNFGDLVQLRWLYEECNGDWDQIKAKSKDSVEFMIRLGQSARDVAGEDVWIDAAFPNQPYNYAQDGNIVISDIRQPNEVEFLYRNGGELWKIERKDTEKRGMDDLLRDVKFEATIVNNSTLEDLEKTIDMLMEAGGWEHD